MHFHINTDASFPPPYGIMIALSFAAGCLAMYLLNVRCGIQKNIARYLLILTLVLGILGGIGLTYITSGGETIGLSSLGGLAGVYAAALTMGLISPQKGDLRIMAETGTIALPLMYSVSKVGCFLAGCCHGIPYDGLFAVEYTGEYPHADAVFPVQLTETIVFMLIFPAALALYLRKKKYAVPVVLIVSAAAKCVLDSLRESHIGITLSITQILCLVLVVIGIIWLIITAKRKQTDTHCIG